MKKIRIFLILIFVSIIIGNINVNSAFVLKSSPQLINAYNNGNLVRLHIIANSNSPRDQYIKRKVRDNITTYLANSRTEQDIKDNLLDIKGYINEIMEKEGLNQKVDVEYGNYYFPRRTYDKLTLPPGEYQALRIVLGNGQGANWWCVLLPPVCIEKEEISEKDIEFKFKLAELLGIKDFNKIESKEIKIRKELLDKIVKTYRFNLAI